MRAKRANRTEHKSGTRNLIPLIESMGCCRHVAGDVAKSPVLFRFFVNNVLANMRVILAQFEALCGVAAVLGCVIHMTAFRAAELDQNTIAFFRHNVTIRCVSCVSASRAV